MHSSGSIARKFGPSWKQSTGHTSTQSMYLHLMQFSVTTKVMRVPSVQPLILASRQAAVDCREMMLLVAAGSAILEITLQRKGGAEEGDLLPWNLLRMDQLDLQTLRSGAEFGLGQAGAEEHMDLLRMQDVHHAQERADLDLRQGFLLGLPGGGLLQGLI